MTMQAEIESKFIIDADVARPELAHISVVHSSGEPVESRQVAHYFDTADIRLALRGITLRRRSGGSDAGWHAKLPAAGAHERTELRYPLESADDGVPKDLLRDLMAYTRGAPVAQIADLDTNRTEQHLFGERGENLAIVADDLVRSRRSEGRSVSLAAWREIEVELVEGDASALEAISDRLMTMGLERSPFPSKLHHALGQTDTPLRAEWPSTDKISTVGDLVWRHLTNEVNALLARDRMARTDEPNGVHKMRVATRRLRSALATFRPAFDKSVTEPLRQELKWLGGALGEPRDAEVLRRRLEDAARKLPVELRVGPVVARLERELNRRHEEAFRRLTAVLEDQRYFRLLDSLDDLLASPPFTDFADRPAQTEARSLVTRSMNRFERIAKTSDSADAEHRDESLHEVRKAAKRVRYAAESATPVLGSRAKDVAKAYERLQDHLGEVQDSVASRAVLRDIGMIASLAGENGFSFGLLYGREEAFADESAACYPKIRNQATGKVARRLRRG